MARIVVTGASGLIGSAVCDALLARGDEVVGLSRDPSRARSTNPTVTWHAWSPVAERPPAEALEGVDGAINLVGESINQRLTVEVKEQILETRVRGTKNLVDGIAAAKSGPGVLVSQSAVGYYGDRGEAIVDESTDPGPENEFLVQVPVAWEAAAREAENADIRTTVVRTGLVLDPRGGLLKQLLLPFRLGLGGPIASGRQFMPWIHIDDEIALLLWALDSERVRGPLNGTSPNPVTNRDFTKTLGKVLGRPAVMPVPKAAVSLLRGGELAEGIAAGQRAIPRRALDLGFGFRYAELETALRNLLGR